MTPTNEPNIIERGVHCPFCDTDEAILMSRATFKKFSLQTPAFGLKFILLLLFYPLTIFQYGLKLFDFTKGITYDTYGFCPKCGNSYPAFPPNKITAKNEEPKFYRNKPKGKVTGLCMGIAEYTGLSVGWVRLLTAVYCLASFVMAIVGSISLIRAEASFGDILSAVFNGSIPSIVVGAVYLTVSAFIPLKRQ